MQAHNWKTLREYCDNQTVSSRKDKCSPRIRTVYYRHHPLARTLATGKTKDKVESNNSRNKSRPHAENRRKSRKNRMRTGSEKHSGPWLVKNGITLEAFQEECEEYYATFTKQNTRIPFFLDSASCSWVGTSMEHE